MNMITKVGTGIKMLIASAIAITLIVSSSVVLGQTVQKPKKPDPNDSIDNMINVGKSSDILMPVPTSMELNNELGYWSHITTQNTGSLPFGESQFYRFPRYWNYVFVDSNNRLFTDSGGLYVWNGAYWRAVTANGEQISRVREIVEDDNGNLWLGTHEGLIKLNSALQFIDRYTTENSNLKKNDINTLWIEDDGSLWIGHRWDEHTGGGVTIFNEQVIEGLGGYTNDIIQRSNGDVWLSQAPDNEGNGGFIYVYRPSNDSSWTYTVENSGLPRTDNDNFTEDSQGNIWMGHYGTFQHPMGGVTKFDGTDWTHFDQSDGLPRGGAWYTYAASDDKVYYTTNDSIMVYENDSWNHFMNDNERFPLKGSTIITEDRDDNLVIGADPGVDLSGGGVHIYDGSSWDFISSHTDNGLFSNVIFGADVDTEGNLWFSGFYGAAMYDGENWTYFSENDGMSRTYAWKLLAASDGSVWFGVSAPVTRYQNGEFTVYDDYVGFEEAIFEDSNGNIWFGAWDWKNRHKQGGILKYDGTNFTVYDDSDGLIGEHITAIGEGPNGNIYASTYAGVAVFDGSSWSEFPVDGQTGIGVGELASDANNNLWFDIQGTIKKWDGSHWTTYDDSDGYMGWTAHIEPAPDGSIWLAGYKIQVIRDDNLIDITPNAEYSGTFSYVITHDNEGATWIGTYGNGLFKYEMSEGLVIESIEDYPEDQGGWITVTSGGFLMDEHNISDPDYNPVSWGIQRKNNNKWEIAGTSFEFSAMSNQMSVQVPTTMPTGKDLDEHKYDFRVAVYDATGKVLGYSETATAYALDNLAPSAVNNIMADRGSKAVTVSWKAPSDNDIKQYEIVSVDNQDSAPLATTHSTAITLSDDQYDGIQKLMVHARDRHENIGDASEMALAVFPMDLNYEVEARWNLLGLPLDVSQNELADFASQIQEGTLYEFNGSYQPAQELVPGKGYWAKFEAAGDYQVPGLPLVEQTVELDEGWNLISGIGAVFGYDQIEDPDGILIEGTLSAFKGSYAEAEALAPGAGYWLQASEPGSVTFSLLNKTATSAKQKSNTPTLAEVKEHLNSVLIQSADGSEQTLYFGQQLPDKVNPLSFSMPPPAPGNAFDARFSDNSRFIDSDEFTVNIQPGQSGAITIELNLLSDQEHQEYIVHALSDDKKIGTHELTAENGVTLSSSKVTGLTFTPAGKQQAADNVPDKFDLGPSYPNPFNPTTTIQYQLPQLEAVQLDVFNMAGQKVRTLVAGEQQNAGRYTVRFDASSLSSGIYFVRLQAGSFQQIQKITLVK